jgi:D-2-hydroxyacid dehydrogenase (NADP+)
MDLNATSVTEVAFYFCVMKKSSHLVNVARGEIVDESALEAALRDRHIAGAFLDVFAHEPLHKDSALWGMRNVIITPHTAGFSDGNAARVDELFLQNLKLWLSGFKKPVGPADL